jgi:hypothetical protein
MILTFLLSAAFVGVSIVGFDLCQVLYEMFTDPTQTVAYTAILGSDVASVVVRCSP